MKIIPLLFLVLLFSCAAPSPEAQKHAPGDTCIDMPLIESQFGTDWDVRPVHPPPPFRLDSIIANDTVHNVYTARYFIVCDEYPGLLGSSMAVMPDAGFIPDETDEARSDESWVASFSKSGDLLSLFFVGQSYTNGAAHYNRDAASVNFNCKTKKAVSFSDVFRVSNSSDRQKFCELINAGYNAGKSAENMIAFDSSSIGSRCDFTISCGDLVLYPGEVSYISYTATAFTVPLEKVKAFIRPEYGWLIRD